MGSAVSTSFLTPAKSADVFSQTAMKEEFAKFLELEHSALSFAQFIKNGHWLGMLSHYDHCDHSKSATPKTTARRTELRWIYQHFVVVDPLKEQVDEFLRLSAVNENMVANTSSRKAWQRTLPTEFHESYKYNPETATFTLGEMAAIMCTILFPLYLGSEEYQHWKAWHVAKSRKINGPYLATESGEHTAGASAQFEEGVGSADVEHLKHMLLSSAAFVDQAELLEHFARPTLFEDARMAIYNSSFGVCICSAHPTGSDYPVLYVNQAFERMTGYKQKQLAHGITSLHGAETERMQIERLNASLREQRDAKLVLTLHRRNRTKFLAAVAVKPSYDNTGGIVYWIALYFDLSARGSALIELKRVDDLLALIPNLLNYPTPQET
jgi:PAS domain S-box-containing protein